MKTSVLKICGALGCALFVIERATARCNEAFAGDGNLVFTTLGDNAGDTLGASVASAGDVNGDQRTDLVVGAPELGVDFARGYVKVVSGADGAILRTIDAPNFFSGFGQAVAGGEDFNGDGAVDVIIGAPTDRTSGSASTAPGMVRVISSSDWSTLYTWEGDSASDQFGWAVANAGDVNNDGHPDIVVGIPYDDNNGFESGSVRVFSGASGSALFTVIGSSAGIHLGLAVAGAGDVNNDGRADIVAAGTDNKAYVYSGAGGALLYTFTGPPLSEFGKSVSGAGDVDNDGWDDVIVGGWKDNQATGLAGMARVFSGQTGAVIREFHGDHLGALLGRAVSSGDIDGDAHSDLIVAGNGFVKVFAGVDGSVLGTLSEPAPFNGFGVSASSAGDVDNDGRDEIVVGIPTETSHGTDAGAAMIINLDATPGGGNNGGSGADNYCTAQANSYGWQAAIGHSGSRSVSAGDLNLTAAGAVPNSNGIFFYGSDQASTPFGGGTMCVGGSIFRLGAPQVASNVGSVQLDVDFSRLPVSEGPGMITPGSTWNFQYWYRDNYSSDPSHFNLTNGLRVTFLP